VSRDFEVVTNVSCEESTVSPLTGLIFLFIEDFWHMLFHRCFSWAVTMKS